MNTPLRPSYKLKEDALAGFKESVKNGQNRLALEYLVSVINELQTEINELKETANNASLAPARKVTKATTTEDVKDGDDK